MLTAASHKATRTENGYEYRNKTIRRADRMREANWVIDGRGPASGGYETLAGAKTAIDRMRDGQ